MGICWGSPAENPTPTTTGHLSTGTQKLNFEFCSCSSPVSVILQLFIWVLLNFGFVPLDVEQCLSLIEI